MILIGFDESMTAWPAARYHSHNFTGQRRGIELSDNRLAPIVIKNCFFAEAAKLCLKFQSNELNLLSMRDADL